jgi:hypothetical protein
MQLAHSALLQELTIPVKSFVINNRFADLA